MDRRTINEYGWIVVVIIIICILISTMPGIGLFTAKSFISNVNGLTNKLDEALDRINGNGIDTTKLVPGLYYSGTDVLIKDWDTLLAEDIISVEDGYIYLANSYNVYEDPSAVSVDDDSISTFGTNFQERYLSGDLVIASGVTGIMGAGFSNTQLLTGVTFPDSITVIEDNAFMMCSDLKFIIMQEGITEIRQAAFAMSGLKSLNIPSTVTELGLVSTAGCDNLTTITVTNGNSRYYSVGNCIIDTTTKAVVAGCRTSVIPDSEDVTKIEYATFNTFYSLKHVKIPKNITYIEEGNFGDCPNIETITVAADNPTYSGTGNCLIEKATKTLLIGSKNSVIPDDGSVEVISSTAFTGRSGPEKLIIPSTVKTISAYAFECVSNIKELVISGGIENIKNYAFCQGSFEKVTITGEIGTIEQGTFVYCISLKEVVLQEGFTSIIPVMFEHTPIEKITIPVSVVEIRPFAFNDCTELTDIYYEGTMEQWNQISFEENWNQNSGNYTIHCADGDIAKS